MKNYSLNFVKCMLKTYKKMLEVENFKLLGKMNSILLKKIEELTLYTIAQQKQIDELKLQMSNIKK